MKHSTHFNLEKEMRSLKHISCNMFLNDFSWNVRRDEYGTWAISGLECIMCH